MPAGLIPDGQHRPPTSRRTGTFQLHPGEAPAGLLPPFEGWLDKTSGGKEVGGGAVKERIYVIDAIVGGKYVGSLG